MDTQMINLTIALLVFMSGNVMLGSVNSLFDGSFDKAKFWKGLGKATVVLICYVCIYYAGSLNPDIIVMKINDIDVNMLTAIYISVVGGYVAYGAQLTKKLVELVVPKK